MQGDADLAATAALVADPRRARILMALADGRALPASVLAAEAGVAPSTASGHLARLVGGGLLVTERHGRHRYFRLARPAVGRLLEALAELAPVAPVRSLREGTRAELLRTARSCYDHLAGRAGTALMAALLARDDLTGGDGTVVAGHDRLAAQGDATTYALTPGGAERLRAFGLDVDGLRTRPRPLVRYCVDWSEQRHHLAGGLGAALAARVLELGWLERVQRTRALRVTPEGARGLRETFGVEL